MLKVINLIQRACLMFNIRALETELHDNETLRKQVGSESEFLGLYIRREEIRRELTKARGDYNALLPAGKRVVWKCL